MSIHRRTFIKQAAFGALQFGILTELLAQETYSLKAGQLNRSSPEKQDFSAQAILNFVKSIEESNLHSLMIVKNGHVIAEGWWAPYAPDLKHTLYSLSKSFTSTAIGFAVSEGKLSVNDKVVSFFPDKLPGEVSGNLAEMRVKDLLTMSTGHAQDTTGKFREKGNKDWVGTFLAQPVAHQPGTHFVYNSGATYMLSAILKKVTGENLTTFLKPRLFDPLDITDFDWEVDPTGIQVGGWGLRVKTEDIAKLGQLYLQKGEWNGKSILSADWVSEASTAHIMQAGKEEDRPKSDWLQGYGYQFWRCRHNSYRGDGAYGQYCIVMPDQQMVIAITSETSDMQVILNQVWKHLLVPAKGVISNRQLTKELNKLALSLPQGAGESPLVPSLHGVRFKMDNNSLEISELSIEITPKKGTLLIQDGKGRHSIPFGMNQWKRGATDLAIEWLKLVPTPVEGNPWLITEASAFWDRDDTLEILCRFIDTAHYMQLTLTFSGNNVSTSIQKSTSIISKDSKPYAIIEGTKVA